MTISTVENQVKSISYDCLWNNLNSGAIQAVKDSLSGFNKSYEDMIYGNINLRTLQKMLYTTNIKSVSWGICRDITSDEVGELPNFYWTEPYVIFTEESGVKENDLSGVKAETPEDLAFILAVLKVDFLRNIPAFGSTGAIELNHSAMHVNSGAVRGDSYTMSFMQSVQRAVNREIAIKKCS